MRTAKCTTNTFSNQNLIKSIFNKEIVKNTGFPHMRSQSNLPNTITYKPNKLFGYT